MKGLNEARHRISGRIVFESDQETGLVRSYETKRRETSVKTDINTSCFVPLIISGHSSPPMMHELRFDGHVFPLNT